MTCVTASSGAMTRWQHSVPWGVAVSLAMRQRTIIHASLTDRAGFEAVVADGNRPRKQVWRARVALAATGRRPGVSRPSVRPWREWFAREGLAGLLRDKSRKASMPPLPQAVVELTLRNHRATRGTGRMMAETAGMSLRSVRRICRAHRLAPHQVRPFKLSRDPAFVAKLHDLAGLYVHPPTHALVLAVDEKRQRSIASSRSTNGTRGRSCSPSTPMPPLSRSGARTTRRRSWAAGG